MSRINLITDRSQLAADRQEEADAILEVLHHLGGPFGALLHSPGLALKVCQAGAHVRLESTLEKWQRELAILVVAAGKYSDFEWASHVELARTAGVAEPLIDAVRTGLPAGPDASEDEADLVSFARQLVTANRVDSAVYDRLASRHGERWLVELAATIGQYQYIACVLGAFDVQPAPGKERIAG